MFHACKVIYNIGDLSIEIIVGILTYLRRYLLSDGDKYSYSAELCFSSIIVALSFVHSMESFVPFIPSVVNF